MFVNKALLEHSHFHSLQFVAAFASPVAELSTCPKEKKLTNTCSWDKPRCQFLGLPAECSVHKSAATYTLLFSPFRLFSQTQGVAGIVLFDTLSLSLNATSWSRIKAQSCCCSVAQACATLSDPMDCSTPGLPVHHQLLELAQTHVHWVGDAIQPPHPLSPPSLPTFNLSQHQGFFQWAGSSHQVIKVLEPQLQQQSFQWIFRVDSL